MNRIEKLINEFCPDGVKKEKLKNLAEIGTGNSNRQDATEDGQYTFFVRSKDTLKSSSYEYDEEAIIIPSEGGIGEVFHYINDKYALHQRAYRIHVVSDLLDTKFLYHYMKSAFKKFITKKAVSATVTSIRKPMIEDFEVPLPPLSIQSEIVHILDSFTLLTAELTAELTARKKQYAFYRDYLLDFSNEDVRKEIPDIDCSNVEFKKLGEVCNVQSGGTPSKKKSEYWNGGTIPWLASTVCKNKKSVEEVTNYITEKGLKNSSAKMMKEKTTLIALVGATIGKIAFLPFEASINQNVAGLFPIDENIVNADYLFYACSTLYSKFQNLGNGKLAMANMSFVRNLVIPVPPLLVQENIVKILDRFDKLNNDMSEGLPAEIEARKKQYEYYRDTLLSFDNKACSQIVKVERERELTRIKAIKWLKLCDIADIGTGSSNTNEALEVGKYPFFVRSQDVKRKDTYEFDETAIITSGDGVGVGKIFHFVEGKYALHQRAYRIHITDENVLPKYFFYYMKATFLNYIEKNSFHSSVTSVRRPMLNNYFVPVPPLEEQERIVLILDRFDKLCNDISEGLPAEIEARQKQYEYYRDKLLMFKRVEANEK